MSAQDTKQGQLVLLMATRATGTPSRWRQSNGMPAEQAWWMVKRQAMTADRGNAWRHIRLFHQRKMVFDLATPLPADDELLIVQMLSSD